MFSALYQNHPKRCNVGDTLRALIFDEEGNEVNPEDVDAEIQWYADGVEITDETDAEYTVLVGDVGVKLSVKVTIGDETYTAETEEVEAAPVEELKVTIVSEDEIPTVGELLTAVVTDEDGELVDAELLHYQWYAGEDAIDESDTAILLVTDEFVGKTLSVEVTDADGNTFKSEPTAEVEAGEPVEELTVSIDNTTPKVGDILTATVVDRNGEDVSDNVTFQWYADDVAIEGADEETLVVDADLLGAALKVVVTAENGNTFESEETEEVEAEEALYTVTIDDTTPVVGQTLTAIILDAEGEEVEDTSDFAYQWYADGEKIRGEKDAELYVDDDLLGSVLSVVIYDADDNEYASEETEEVTDEAVDELTVSLDNYSPRVGDTLTASIEDADGEEVDPADFDIQWYAGDVAIAAATDNTFAVTSEQLGKALKVIATDAEGNAYESDATDPVKSDKSAEIKLVDRNGLQPDGTALDTDILDVSYGADLGTPNIIIWYCNGAAKAVYSLNGGNINANSFISTPVVDPLKGTLDAGDWWVTIENTSGDVSVTNVITVASNERAIISDFSIENDYDTPNVDIATTTAKAIMNVTFNKQYFGKLYLNEVENETYTVAKMVGGAATGEIDLSTTAIWDTSLTKVTKSSDFTNAKATAAKAGGTQGIYYIADDGSVSAKIVVPAAVTRGTEYELIFDQVDVSSDDLGAKAEKENLNVTESFTAPYVEAPAEIVVTKYAKNNTTPEITMYNEDGAVLNWWTGVNTAAATATGFDSMKFYSIDSNTASASDTAATTTNVKIEDGVVTLTIGAAANDYGYAKFTTTKGIFAAKSATITSEINEGAMDPMTNMTLAQDSTTPQSAKVTFKNLKGVASGTVYIYQAKDAADLASGVATVAAYAHSKALGSAEVEGGATSVVIEDVFESVDTANAYKNNFVAVFEPTDTVLFKSVYNGGTNSGTITVPSFFELTQKLTKYELVGSADAQTAVASKYKFSAANAYDTLGTGAGTKAYLAAKDQFGDTMLGNVTGVAVAATTLTPVASTFNGDAPADVAANKVTFATTAAGANANEIVLTDGSTTSMAELKALVKDNALSATLTTGQTIKLTVDTAAAGTGLITFKLSLS